MLAPCRRKEAALQDRVIVAGAGAGGLAAAMELAHAGCDVTVVEAAEAPGGKMRALPSPAGPVDAGPTVLTLRHVFDSLFADCGQRLEDFARLDRATTLARHQWRDGSRLDLFDDPAASEAAIADFAGPEEARRFAAFDARCRRLFEAFDAPVLRSPRPTPLAVAAAVADEALPLTRAMAPLSSLWRALGGQFRDARLRQLFARYSTYVGGSPLLSPALLMLVWRSEAAGVWMVEGGMHALARAMEAAARAAGARFRYGARVARIDFRDWRAAGVTLGDGERLEADAVLFNGDPSALASGLLGEAARPAAPRMRAAERSLSACVWAFSAEATGFPLIRHNVFFNDDYPAEFRALFRDRRVPADPTVYVCAQDRPGRDAPRPAGPERFEIIINAPADGDRRPLSEEEIARCTETAFDRLQEAGLSLSERPSPTTPTEFEALFPGTGGAIYGRVPHGSLATFRRPTARSRIQGLYLAGGGTHPGPGVPMATLSGRHAAGAILQDLASTSRSRRAATPGGTSTPSPTTDAGR
jgi:1-hydroxycarotenoid 3,4-desaturase